VGVAVGSGVAVGCGVSVASGTAVAGTSVVAAGVSWVGGVPSKTGNVALQAANTSIISTKRPIRNNFISISHLSKGGKGEDTSILRFFVKLLKCLFDMRCVSKWGQSLNAD